MTMNGGEIPGRRHAEVRVFVMLVVWRRGLALGLLRFSIYYILLPISCVLYIDLGSLYLKQRVPFSDCIYITLAKQEPSYYPNFP